MVVAAAVEPEEIQLVVITDSVVGVGVVAVVAVVAAADKIILLDSLPKNQVRIYLEQYNLLNRL